MDPLFLNLPNITQQASMNNAIGNASSSQISSHVNGLPQESKLATYMTNRSQISSNSQLQQQQSVLTKNLAALGLDGVIQRKTQLSNLGEFLGSPSGLAHSASTPSFQNFTAISSNIGNPPTFSPLTRASASSPQRASPPPQGSPSRVLSSALRSSSPAEADTSQNSTTFHENVGGTTYFFTAQDLPFASSGTSSSRATGAVSNAVVYSPYQILPPTPSHIHHLRSSSQIPGLFAGDELRQEILARQVISMAQVDREQQTDLPQEVDMYHELVPLEGTNTLNKSSMFSYPTSAYKATNIRSGVQYCLYRIHGFRLNNVKVTQLVDMWKKLQHSSIVQLREPSSVSFEGVTSVSSNSSGSDHTNIHRTHRHGSGNGVLSESALWSYIIQLTGAIRAVHTQGLSCRTLDPTKILITDNKGRIRINCCGILDVLTFDPNSSNALGSMSQHQQDDLNNLGKLIVALSCNSVLALQPDRLHAALELINRNYSRDLSTLVVYLLTNRVKSVNDIMPMIGARFYTAVETATQRADVCESELGKELHNGRLFRLLSKLSTVIERPMLNMDSAWSETGDRYMLKLFRSFVFHQVTEDGVPWLDIGHIVSVLNKLEVGSPDQVCLMSHDEQNILVTTYTELKRCFERSFIELFQSASRKCEPNDKLT